jgi:excisionase family DNA binding protein
MALRTVKKQEKREKLYTIDEMSALLQVERRKIVEWVQYRRIPYVLVAGEKIRFRISDIAEWVESRTRTKPAYKIRQTL